MLQSLEQVRAVGDFARSYLWDCQFPAAPSPFNEWFPANDIEEQLAQVENHILEFYLNYYEFPKNLQSRRITLTFFDSQRLVLKSWFEDWINNIIFNGGSSVSALEDCVRELKVMKLNLDRTIYDLRTYWVFPTGSFSDHRTSDSTAVQYSLEFLIAGQNRPS